MINYKLNYEGKELHNFSTQFNCIQDISNIFMFKNFEAVDEETTFKCHLLILENDIELFDLKFYVCKKTNYLFYNFLIHYIDLNINRFERDKNFKLMNTFRNLKYLIIANESDSKRVYIHEFIIESINKSCCIHSIIDKVQLDFETLEKVCNNLYRKDSTYKITTHRLDYLIEKFKIDLNLEV